MATGTKITKTLTPLQMELLKRLDEEEIAVFDLETVGNFERGNKSINEIVENLVQKGFLHRLERGKYCRSTFRDENVIGAFIAQDSVIAYWSALHLHGLTEQFPNTVFVQTTKKKNAVSIFGANYQFIKINPQKRVGVTYNGYGSYKYPITDVEKTIVDCFDLPQYSGGFAELIRAFYSAELAAEKLISYCTSISNIAVVKRIGFLAELFEKNNLGAFIEFAKATVNRTYNLFDPFGITVGEPDSEWYLRLNLARKNILGIVQNQY